MICLGVGILGLLGLARGELGVVGVRNFRPVTSRLPGVFRSGSPEMATAEDLRALERLNVCTMVDLRTNEEVERARANATPEGRQLAESLDANEGRWRRIHVPVLDDMDGFFDAIEAQLPLARKAEALLYRAVSGQKLNELLYAQLSEGGNAVLNTAMLASSPSAFGSALRATADGLANGEGVLIHCAYGKDRTGVLAALLQLAVGDSIEHVVDSYARSEQILGRHTFLEDSSHTNPEGADLTSLQGSPPHGAREMIRWLEATHGGVDGYLALAGCTSAWRARLLDAGRVSAA
jgi:rhodanese-related sulfurtransferase